MDTQFLDLNITLSDCLSRMLVGISLIIATLLVDAAPSWLALLGAYPILTAMLTWDPVYALIDGLRNKMAIDTKTKLGPVLTH